MIVSECRCYAFLFIDGRLIFEVITLKMVSILETSGRRETELDLQNVWGIR